MLAFGHFFNYSRFSIESRIFRIFRIFGIFKIFRIFGIFGKTMDIRSPLMYISYSRDWNSTIEIKISNKVSLSVIIR